VEVRDSELNSPMQYGEAMKWRNVDMSCVLRSLPRTTQQLQHAVKLKERRTEHGMFQRLATSDAVSFPAYVFDPTNAVETSSARR
jgi:hypothetical protein